MGPVECLQRVERPACVTELPVVVVLDDDCAACPREVPECRPPGKRQAHPERELVRGGDADHLGIAREAIDRESVVVDRDGSDSRTRCGEDTAQTRIAGLLDGDGRPAWRDQDSSQQIERLLRPAVTTMSSGVQAMARAKEMWPAIASRSLGRPSGSS